MNRNKQDYRGHISKSFVCWLCPDKWVSSPTRAGVLRGQHHQWLDRVSSVEKCENEWRLYTVRRQIKCILHGESAMRDYLNGDIDSACGSLSREDPMFLGIARQVVPPLIVCDSSVRDAQMTRYFARKRLEESALNKEGCFRYCSQRYLESNRLYGGCFNYLVRTEMALVRARTHTHTQIYDTYLTVLFICIYLCCTFMIVLLSDLNYLFEIDKNKLKASKCVEIGWRNWNRLFNNHQGHFDTAT